MTFLNLESVADLTPKNLKKLEDLVSQKNTVLLNHANWCGHCQIFKPEWNEFRQNIGKKVNLVQIENDALSALQKNKTLYKKVVPKDGVVYFPMIIIFLKKNSKKTSEKKIYDGNRTAFDLKSYIDTKVKVKPVAATKPKVENEKTVTTRKSKKEQTQQPQIDQKKALSLFELNKELDDILAQLSPQ